MPGTALYDQQGNLVGTYSGIQQAVDAALNGYTVQLATGNYREQVTVTDKIITIKGNGQGQTVIEAPDANNLSANTNYVGSSTDAVIGVRSSNKPTGLTIQGLTIDGRNQGTVAQASSSPNLAGIGGTNASISADRITIKNIQDVSSGSLNGRPRNTGILVDNTDGAARSFSLTNSTVNTFQRNGLTLNGAGLTVDIRGNTITGAGATTALAQNGIQVSRGATGTISGNTLSGLDYTPATDAAAAILAFQAGSGLAVTGNVIDGVPGGNAGQIGVHFYSTEGGSVVGNRITDMVPSILADGTFTTPLSLNSNTISTTGSQNGFQFAGTATNTTGYNVNGTTASDFLQGALGNDTLSGLGGADAFFGGGGDDQIYANGIGIGANTTGVSGASAEYVGPKADYTVTQNGDGSFTILNTGNEGEGRDTLHGVDTLVFDGGGGSTDLTAYPPPPAPPSGGASGSNPANAITPGPDVVIGTSVSDTIAGLAGDDTITGGGGDDLILGNQGNDIITDGDGQNTVYGGMDNDRITVGNGSNLLYGGEGSDTISAGNGGNTIVGGTGNSAIDSLDGADFITSGSGNDLILGNGGDDTIGAGAGRDTVAGGFGKDVILGNQGDDVVLGNQGDDTLFGGYGKDTLVGGQGNDVLYGNQGDDVLYGNEGLNTFVFDTGDTGFKPGQSTGDTIMDFATGTSRIDFAAGPAGTASNFGATSTTSTDFATIQAAAQALIDGGATYAFVADGVDGFLFTTGGSGTSITDAVKLAGAGTATAVKSQDIAHGALA